MNAPFNSEQFLGVFRTYNIAIFPMQIAFYLLAITTIYLTIKPSSFSNQVITFVLAFLWLWMGIVYQISFFATINKAAYLFGVFFIAQGILFLVFGVFQRKLSFAFQPTIYGITGFVFIIFSLVGYPIASLLAGHTYPSSPTFGLPCPTTIFTFGLLLLNTKKTPIAILLIPSLWSAIGLMAVIKFDMIEDTALIITCLVTIYLLASRNKILAMNVMTASPKE